MRAWRRANGQVSNPTPPRPACDRKWPRGASLSLRGFGSQHAAHDLYPPTPFDAILAALLPSVDAPDEFDDLPLLLDAKDVESERETEMV